MRKTVYLHIGAPKSGSTYLQAQMWANRDVLRKHGINLPGNRQVSHFHAGSDLRDEPMREGDQRQPGAWARLVAKVEEADDRVSIISDERLSHASASQVANAVQSLAPHDIHVIYCVREFAGLLPSEWQQNVKWAGGPPLDEWLSRLAAGGHRWFWRAHDVGGVLTRWNVPRDRVHLVLVPPSHTDRMELWRRFASIVGAPAELPNEPPRANESLGLDETELVRRVYQHIEGPPPPFRVQSLMRSVVSRQTLAVRENSQPILLPESFLPWVADQARRRRMHVASSGGQVVGELDELDLDESRFVAAVRAPDEARVLDAGMDVIETVTRRIDRARRRGVRRRAGPSETPGPLHNASREASSIAPASPRSGPARHVAATLHQSVRAALTAGRGWRRQARSTVTDDGPRNYYLHIGPPATDSVNLQRLLWCNRGMLSSEGVYIPGTSQADHDAAAAGLLRPPQVTWGRHRRRHRAWDRLITDAERSGHRKIVITSELLACAPSEEIGRALSRLDGADVHVIYVLRELTSLLPAAWLHQVRSPTTHLSAVPPWTEWLDRLTSEGASVPPWWEAHEVAVILERWRQRGTENVHLLLYPQSMDPISDLCERFRAVVGWRSPIPTGASERCCPLGHAQAELLRRVRKRIDDRKLDEVNRALMSLEPLDAVALPDVVRPWVEEKSASRRLCTADRRIHVVGERCELEQPASAFSEAAPEPTDAAMADAAVRVTASLVEELATLQR